MSYQQSISAPMFLRRFPDKETLVAAIAEVGFPALEIWNRGAEFKEWLGLAQKHNLKVCNMIGHRAAMNRPECHAEAEREIIESVEIAAEHGIPGLICFGGNAIEGQSRDEALDTVVEGFRRAAPHAEKKGVTLLLELLNSCVDHPGYLADHTAWGLEVCRRVKSPRLRLLYDIYHMQIMEGDIIRTIRDNIAWLGHFHTAGNPGRQEIGATQELNYAAIAQAIRESGFTGYVGHEFLPAGDPVAAMREARQLMDPSEKAPG